TQRRGALPGGAAGAEPAVGGDRPGGGQDAGGAAQAVRAGDGPGGAAAGAGRDGGGGSGWREEALGGRCLDWGGVDTACDGGLKRKRKEKSPLRWLPGGSGMEMVLQPERRASCLEPPPRGGVVAPSSTSRSRPGS